MDYEQFFLDQLAALKAEGNYRVFAVINRQAYAYQIPFCRHYRPSITWAAG